MTNRIMTTMLMLLLIKLSLGAQTPQDIKTTYDKFKDVTTVSGTRLFEHFKTSTVSVGIGVVLQVSGNKIVEPNKLDLIFMEFDDFTKNSDGEWWAIADGERIRLGKILATSKPVLSTGSLTIKQHYGVTTVSSEVFRKLAKANKVEMKIGTFEITEGRGKLWNDLQASRSLYREILNLIDQGKK